ncbi:MAG: helix-turn-helix transcriptional regulator [Lachnospiraceae bacterium]|nr:helix-turn-helix transcriptional regulator [Lachnospiraceae bacterium]
MIISENIARLRKERGLTQEQLGSLVGVSSQAVSKWEKGGAPDVELLPLIADVLGVSLDGLFGRESIPGTDISQLIVRYLQSFPIDRRIKEMYKLVTYSVPGLGIPDSLSHALDDVIGVRKTAYLKELLADEPESWMRSLLADDNGIMLTVSAEDFPLYLLLPEPTEGYAYNLADTKDYQRLFALLGQDGALKLILWFAHKRPDTYISASAASAGSGIPSDDANRLLQEMADCGLFSGIDIEMTDGSTKAYQLTNDEALIPFLYLARWLMQQGSMYFYAWKTRKKPWLSSGQTDAHSPAGSR